MNRLIQALAIVAVAAVAQGCVHHNHGTRRVVVQSEPAVYTSSIDYRYHGYHPVPHAHGGGWCNLNHVHVHHYEPLVSYGYTYYDSYDYWVYSRPRVVYYYGGHYDHHGRFCNHRGRHSHNYVPSTHAASAYTWDSRRNSYVYSPNRGTSGTVRGAPRASPPPGQGVSRPAPRTVRTRENTPRTAPGTSTRVAPAPRTSPRVSPAPAPRTSPGTSPRVSPAPAPRTSPGTSPSPRVAPTPAPRTSPSTSAPRPTPSTPAPRSAPSTPRAAPAPRSAPSESPTRAAPAPRSSSSTSAPRAAPAPRSSPSTSAPRSAPRSAPARSAPSRPASRMR